MTRTHPTIKLFTIGAVAVIAGLLFFSMAAMAQADDAIFEEPSATRIPNGQHQVHWSYPTGGYQGCLADIEVAETNEAQPSAHPGNQLVVAIDGTVIVRLDIETGRGGFSVTTVQAVIGDVIEVWYVFGDDNVTSSGFAVAITCQEVPPSTTTTSPPVATSVTTTLLPGTTTTTEPPTPEPSTTTTSTTVPASSPVPPTVPTTSTPEPTPSTTPSTTAPPTTVPDTTPIPSGVPTGTGGPPDRSLVLPLGMAALAVSAIGVGAYRVSRRGDDE